MNPRDDDDDTSTGRLTQGGARDHMAPGPARRSGRSFWWFATTLVVAAVLVVAWLSRPRKSAPAEAGVAPVSALSPAVAAPAAPVRLASG